MTNQYFPCENISWEKHIQCTIVQTTPKEEKGDYVENKCVCKRCCALCRQQRGEVTLYPDDPLHSKLERKKRTGQETGQISRRSQFKYHILILICTNICSGQQDFSVVSPSPPHQNYRLCQPRLGSSRTEPAAPQELSWCYQKRQKQKNSIWLLGCTLVPAVISPVQFCVLLVYCGFNFPVLLSLLFHLVNDFGNYFT